MMRRGCLVGEPRFTAIVFLTGEEQIALCTTRLVRAQAALPYLLGNLRRSPLLARSAVLVPDSLPEELLAAVDRCVRGSGAKTHSVRPQEIATAILGAMNGCGVAAIVPAVHVFTPVGALELAATVCRSATPEVVIGTGFPPGAAPMVANAEALRYVAEAEPVPWQCDPYVRLVGTLVAQSRRNVPAPAAIRGSSVSLAIDSSESTAAIRAAVASLPEDQDSIVPHLVAKLGGQRRLEMAEAFRPFRQRRRGQPSIDGIRVLALGMRKDLVSGGDRSLRNLAEAGNDPGGMRLRVVVPAEAGARKPAPAWRIPVTEVSSLGHRPGRPSPVHVLSLGRTVEHIAGQHGADVIYANNTPVLRVGAIAALLGGLPLVGRVIDTITAEHAEESLLFACDVVVVPSRFLRDWCIGLGVPAQRIRVVHEGVTSEWLSQTHKGSAFRAKHRVARRSPLIGVVGRLDDPRKAFDVAIRSARVVADRFPEAKMILLGKPASGRWDHVGRLEELVSDLGLTGRVVFGGFEHDMHSAYDAFDVLLHAAAQEPFGFVFIEALARRVPVVAVKGGGAVEVVRDGTDGLLVPQSDPQLLGDALCRLLADPGQRHELGSAGRARVTSLFLADRFASSMARVFDEIAADGDDVVSGSVPSSHPTSRKPIAYSPSPKDEEGCPARG
jgi:glycosyltransferase involved in cell wall biosynthesis